MRILAFILSLFLASATLAQTYPDNSPMGYEQQYMQRQYQQDTIELQRQQAIAQAIQAQQIQQQLEQMQQQRTQSVSSGQINTQLFAPR